MYFLSFLFLGVLANTFWLTTASALVKRGTAQDVINDINAIDNGVQSLTAHTSSYNSGIFLTSIIIGVPILLDVADIHVSNRKGYLDATTASMFSAADSIAIVDAVSSSVAISIPIAVEMLKSKKQYFEEALLVPVVIASMNLLLYDHDTFSAAVLEKTTLDEDTLAEANEGVDGIHNALEEGIAYFQD